ncbi:MAG: hypothetical protein PQ612_06380 [Rickettsiales bacterium]|nr:hypothetical protein [Pseudomonadota bacterium]MDA0966598.1 hypothetical protein [Pseudomonadota bacterium]MDG4543627.1 hypothetical protein [Rickettsiales bacterium]MDG4545774.1 hypothetical protein [Rickettsiales bacterium]MDG4547453.1 hypothetical protein [Rickettsiales bacterium]
MLKKRQKGKITKSIEKISLKKLKQYRIELACRREGFANSALRKISLIQEVEDDILSPHEKMEKIYELMIFYAQHENELEDGYKIKMEEIFNG